MLTLSVVDRDDDDDDDDDDDGRVLVERSVKAEGVKISVARGR